ncbi:hypothetical protein B0H14DRAFT_3857571 [Mycena olivaceomarginata]|nr:hypothetical protein B0H14DRAFT_3857571 [Mycena olivaceomarginata]
MSVAYPIHLLASGPSSPATCRLPQATPKIIDAAHLDALDVLLPADPFHLSSPVNCLVPATLCARRPYSGRTESRPGRSAPCFPPVMISSGAFVRPETHAQGWRLAALMLGAPISSLPNTLPLLSKPELCSAARHTDSAPASHARFVSVMGAEIAVTGLARRRISTLLKPTEHREGYAAPGYDSTPAPLAAHINYGGPRMIRWRWMQSPSNNLTWARGVAPIRVYATSSPPFTLPAALPPRVPLRTSSTPHPRRLELESKRCALRRPPSTHDPRPWHSTSAVRPAPCDYAALHPDTLRTDDVPRVDQTSSSGQFDTHPARPLRLESTGSACTVRPTHLHLAWSYDRAHAMPIPAPAILFPFSPSLAPSLRVRCPRLLPYSCPTCPFPAMAVAHGRLLLARAGAPADQLVVWCYERNIALHIPKSSATKCASSHLPPYSLLFSLCRWIG